MKRKKSIPAKFSALLLAGAMVLASLGLSPAAVLAAELSAGTYEMSGSLSAYLAAMGGVEFGGPLLTGTSLVVAEDGSESLQLTFTKSQVTIYSITCDTFVDVAPSTVTTTRGVEDGTLGIYDSSGNLVTEGVTYTLSEDTALNSADEEVHYVDSVTFPIDSREPTYNVALYINSNVMGVEFCNENDAATESTYSATLTVDWSAIEALEAGEETTATTTAEETTEEETLEAEEDLDGLAIYEVDDDEEDAEEDEDEIIEDAEIEDEEETSDSGGSLVIVAVVVIVIAAAVILFVATRKKKTGAAGPDTKDETGAGK